jgi:sec-independent protein translocase protein TatA
LVIIVKMLSFLQNIGTTELLILFAILVLLFGGKKITELARGVGESKKELKKVAREVRKGKEDDSDENQADE